MGTSATVFRVLMYSVWLGNPGKMLSTVHWNTSKEKGSEETAPGGSHSQREIALQDKHSEAPRSLFGAPSQEKPLGGFFAHFCIPEECEAWPDTDVGQHTQKTIPYPHSSLQSPGSSPHLLLLCPFSSPHLF